MEIVAVLGAGTYLFKSLVDYNLPQRPANPTQEEEAKMMLETPRELTLHQARETGIIAPQFMSTAGRVPWNSSKPPYYVYETNIGGPNTDPTEKAYQLYANALDHYMEDTQEEISRGRMHYARKRGQAIWNAFTRELTLYDPDPREAPRSTNHQGFMWMPPTPTDTDRVEAGALGKLLPPDPLLFTPDAYFMTNSGVTWRNGGTGF